MLVPHSDVVEGPQPMEGKCSRVDDDVSLFARDFVNSSLDAFVVAQPEAAAATAVENPPVEEPPTMKYTWTIPGFTRLNNRKHYSDVFVVGGYKWRVLIFPKGNNVDNLSMYLDVADAANLPYGWSRFSQFGLAIVNQINSSYSIRKESQHQFNSRESDWGFTSFMPLSELYDPTRGYLVNDTVVIEAEVAVRKGTVVEGTIQKLFEGHHMNYIECINVDYKSTRKESFYDLQLDVKGCKDVYESFDKYVEVERLEGDNKYHAEGHDLQDAKKGVLFIEFPPVLQLQLKRFEYDFMRDTMVKINDRYEFPLELDLDRDNRKYLSPDADKSVRNLYTLHSVLVHSGGVHGGHYYAFIRPTLSDQWYKFDDERVTKEDVKRALEEQYGGEEELPQNNPGFNNPPFKFTKYSNAYMLVYIRESEKDKIICNVDEKDIAEHLRVRLKKEKEEKEEKRKYKAQAHLFTTIKVARDEDITEQIGKNKYFDLVDHEKVKSFRIQKQTPFQLFKEEVAKEFGVPVELQRFWIWAKRQNYTYRPNRPLLPHEELQTEERPIPPPDKSSADILLFFKLYDPENAILRYVGRLMVKNSSKPMDIVGQLNQMAGFAPDEEIELFEEIKFEPCVMCEHLDKKTSFRLSQIEDGDIICFQKPLSIQENECPYPDVPSFLAYVQNREVVRFRSLEKPKEDEFTMELSKLHTYDDVVQRLAEKLGLDDPSKIRLTSHNCYSQQPKPQPIKYRGVDHLSDMLAHYNQTSDILYYEVLDIPLPELQGLKTLKVAFHHATKDEVVIHNIRLPKQSTVGDVINELKTKVVELSHPDAELRLLEVFFHKIYKIFSSTERIENINDQYWTLRAEEIPEEEKNIGPSDRLVHVYHFTKEAGQNQAQVQNFGEPFFLVIHEGETLEEIKSRIQKKLHVPDEDFAKWKFASFSMGRPDYLQDTEVVYDRFQRKDVYGAWEQYLGLEHVDNAPKRAYAANQNRHAYEKPVRIYN
ncbi:hypothetical protein Bca101_073674 [Brassica carinata]